MMNYKNMAVCDLRGITDVEVAKEIEAIQNVAVLILPKTENAELRNALAQILMQNVATTIYMGLDEELLTRNGIATLHDGDFSNDAKQITMFNGMVCIMEISPEKHPRLIVNGPVYIRESIASKANITYIVHNGPQYVVDFDGVKTVNGSGVIDAEMLRWLKPKTLLTCGEKVTVSDDVTSEMLDEKIALIIAGNTIICPKAVAGWIRANGEAGEEIIVK